MEESKLFLNPYDNVLRVVILIIGINMFIDKFYVIFDGIIILNVKFKFRIDYYF